MPTLKVAVIEAGVADVVGAADVAMLDRVKFGVAVVLQTPFWQTDPLHLLLSSTHAWLPLQDLQPETDPGVQQS